MYKLARTVQKINSERKYVDQRIAATFSVFDDTVPYLNITRLIAQGSGHQQRVGDTIIPSSLTMTFSVYLPTVTGGWDLADLDYSLTCRILVVQWHEQYDNTAPPEISQILDFTDQSGAIPSLNRVYAPYRRNEDSFTVLLDKFVVPHWIWLNVDQGAGLKYQPQMQNGDQVYTIKIKRMKDVYYNPGVLDGDNHVLLYFISDSANEPDPVCRGVARFSYYDS